LGNLGILQVPSKEEHERSPPEVAPDRPQIVEIRNSMTVQLGHFPLTDSMIEIVGTKKKTKRKKMIITFCLILLY
jgi:hypothetical protein